MQQMEEICLRGKFQATVQITKQAEVPFVADKLAFQRGKIADDFLSAISRAVVQNDHPVGLQSLQRDRRQRLFEKRLAVENRNGGDEPDFHGRKA